VLRVRRWNNLPGGGMMYWRLLPRYHLFRLEVLGAAGRLFLDRLGIPLLLYCRVASAKPALLPAAEPATPYRTLQYCTALPYLHLTYYCTAAGVPLPVLRRLDATCCRLSAVRTTLYCRSAEQHITSSACLPRCLLEENIPH